MHRISSGGPRMKNRRNFYRILQVQADAPVEVVKASYRTIMTQLKVHPDLGGNHAEAALVNEAFETLSDPSRRAEYDRTIKPLVERKRREARADPSSTPRSARSTQASVAATRPAPPTCSFCNARCSRAQVEWHEGTCSDCGSPLFPAVKHRDGEDARRAIGRVPRNMPMRFWLVTSGTRGHAGTTDDLSLNGMRFVSSTSLPMNARVRIECDFCSAVAVVRDVQRNPTGAGWHCGVEFLTLRFRHDRGGIFSTTA